ncbi:acetyltransferase [Haloferax mediterranei ATCC 33500]|nr:acetyltransferase [Haloferax mediterranei ATCC 33500]
MPGAAFLHGDTVTLRTIEREDIDFLHEMINNPDLWQGFGAPNPRSRHTVAQQFEEQNTDVELLICRDEAPAGRVRLVDIDKDWGNAELTCYVAPEFHGRGLATEACQLLIGYGFDHLPVTKIVARIFDSNRASRGLAEKLGFTHEGTLRNHVYHNGRHLDLHHYGLLAEDWRTET